jgi:hypothetical protein
MSKLEIWVKARQFGNASSVWEAFKAEEAKRLAVYAAFCFANLIQAHCEGEEKKAKRERAELEKTLAQLDGLGLDVKEALKEVF